MTAHHRHPLDRLRAAPPPEAEDWAYVDFEADGTDLLTWVTVTALYTGNGELYGLRLGGLTLTEDQTKRMFGKHFARVQWLTTDELHAAQVEWLESRQEEDDA